MSRLMAVVVLATACSGTPDATPAAPAVPVVPHDASAAAVGTAIVAFDPLSGMHLDDDPPLRSTPQKPAAPRQHPIDVTLRSSPPGALAAVDGVPVGITPTFWPGDANGREHEFTFVLGGYAVARYRFVPITSGVIHARLDAVNDELDGGIEPVPSLPPPGGTVMQPPPLPVAPSPASPPRPPQRPAIDAAPAAPDGDELPLLVPPTVPDASSGAGAPAVAPDAGDGGLAVPAPAPSLSP